MLCAPFDRLTLIPHDGSSGRPRLGSFEVGYELVVDADDGRRVLDELARDARAAAADDEHVEARHEAAPPLPRGGGADGDVAQHLVVGPLVRLAQPHGAVDDEHAARLPRLPDLQGLALVVGR